MATKVRSKKLFLNVLDDRFNENRQVSVLSLLTDGNEIYTNNYGKIFTQDEIGSFDIVKDGDLATLKFFPLDGRVNEYSYSFISYDTKQSITDVGGYNFGNIVSVATSNTTVSAGVTNTITQIPTNFTSAKVLIELSSVNDYYEYTELNLVTNNVGEVSASNYGNISFDNEDVILGLGTYSTYVSGSNINIDFHPNDASIGNITSNTVNVSFANTNFSEEGSRGLRYATVFSKKTSIASSPSPTPSIVTSYNSNFQAAYIIAQVTDLTNNRIQLSELLVLNNNNDVYLIEYGNVETNDSIGNFTTNLSSSTEILFTPDANIDVEVVLLQHTLTYAQFKSFPFSINFKNSELSTGVSRFSSGDGDNFRTEFDLKYNGDFIFERTFNAQSSSTVNIDDDYIVIPNHFFVTGEKVNLRTDEFDFTSTNNSIGIANTTLSGIGLTNKLFGDLYVYKVDESKIKFSNSAEGALATVPNIIDITSVGIGQTHYITSTNQNTKCIITIDNVIQAPIVSTSVTSILRNSLDILDTTLDFSGITSFFTGDLVRINDEVMKISSVGVGSTSFIEVQRSWMGTGLSTHLSNSLITKISGNYNIIGSKIHFSSPPYGRIEAEEVSQTGSIITENEIKSTFHGRVFIRSGIVDSQLETYEKNYLFDDISNSFDASNKDFTITSQNLDITGISTDRSLLLINNILQIPEDDYTLDESLNSTEINFTGSGTSISYDPNNASVPRGGIPISIGSSNGFGYQPLVSAGGTAVVSIAGTIQSVSIGNSGSGYRSGIQTNIRVGVQTYSTGIPNIEFIGTATVENGHVVYVNISNPGSGYTNSNPPDIVFDSPLSYSDIPLIYSPKYESGIGTEAKIDIVVGQGSSIIDFNIKNYGYSYNIGDILTVEVNGSTGIPLDTTKSFEEFSIIIDRTVKDDFSGWFVGNLKKLDDFSFRFNGFRRTFSLLDNGNIFSIIAKRGSNIDVKATLLVILNDVIQIPGESYIFNGGSNITFTEAPKSGDECKILFYRGTSGVDVIDIDITETVKIGDSININDDSPTLDELERIVNDINSPTSLKTNLYSSVGVSSNLELLRPVTWCKQRKDTKINNIDVTKDRIEYEPKINPIAKLTKSVGIGSTMIFVDSVKTFFDYKNENASADYIDKIEIIDSSENKTSISTATVSYAGTITSINIVDGGFGYSSNPSVSISYPIGIGSTGVATASASVTSGIVTSIIITNPGYGYTISSPPVVLIESPNAKIESISNVSYKGDYGIISGISTISVGYALTGIVFDLLIPGDSLLRNSSYTNPTVLVSEIRDSYYFEVFNSNIGNGLTSLDKDGSVIGIGTTFIDNVYQVASVSIASTDAYGMGPTNVAKVVVSVSDYNGLTGTGYSNFYGEFSWGLIESLSRPDEKEFTVNNDYGVVGLNSTPTVRRLNSLKFNTYTIV